LSLFCGFDSYRFVCSIIPYLYTRCCARMIANLYHVLTAVDDIIPWLRTAYRCCTGVPDTWLAVVLYLIYNHVVSPIASYYEKEKKSWEKHLTTIIDSYLESAE